MGCDTPCSLRAPLKITLSRFVGDVVLVGLEDHPGLSDEAVGEYHCPATKDPRGEIFRNSTVLETSCCAKMTSKRQLSEEEIS